jgi:hypothetical protein
MNQRTIHISFTNDDSDLYHELMRESALNYIPISVLVRNYIRTGKEQFKMNQKNQFFYAK